MNPGNGEAKIIAPKRKLQPLLPVAEFSDVIMQLVGDPQCKTCFGRYWVGFLHRPDGVISLDICHCASFAETQIVTALRAIAVMANDQDGANKTITEALMRVEKGLKGIADQQNKPGLFRQAIDYVKRFKQRMDKHDQNTGESNEISRDEGFRPKGKY